MAASGSSSSGAGGLCVFGNAFGGSPGSYAIDIGGLGGPDPQESGARGVVIFGNYFDTFAAAINCTGTIAAKTNGRGVVIGGNSVTNAQLIGGYGSLEQAIILPNSIYGSGANGFGSHLAMLGLPAFANRAAAVAAGLTTGQLYQTTTGPDFNIQMV